MSYRSFASLSHGPARFHEPVESEGHTKRSKSVRRAGMFVVSEPSNTVR